jgi:RNA-binding protein NOB1
MLEELVVDSAALIKCTRLDNLAKRIYSIPEVVAEIRDRKARNALSTIPPHMDSLHITVPTEEALRAGKRFCN